jgi:hypothetical protein
MKRILFITAAVGLLIPIVHSGEFAALTWATNAIGLVLAIVLVGCEWLARRNGRVLTVSEGAKAPVP